MAARCFRLEDLLFKEKRLMKIELTQREIELLISWISTLTEY